MVFRECCRYSKELRRFCLRKLKIPPRQISGVSNVCLGGIVIPFLFDHIQEREWFLVLQKMHQHIGCHDSNVLLTEDPLHFFSVSQNYLNLFRVFLRLGADLSTGISINSGTGFICHSHCCKIGLLIGIWYLNRGEGKAGFLI